MPKVEIRVFGVILAPAPASGGVLDLTPFLLLMGCSIAPGDLWRDFFVSLVWEPGCLTTQDCTFGYRNTRLDFLFQVTHMPAGLTHVLSPVLLL